jgi:hypothetical protein
VNLVVVDLSSSRFDIIDKESKSWNFRNIIIVSVDPDPDSTDYPFLDKLADAGRICLSLYYDSDYYDGIDYQY